MRILKLSVVIFLSSMQCAYAVPLKMEEEFVLLNRLSDCGPFTNNFDQYIADIVVRLAGRTIDSNDVVLIVEQAIDNYMDSMRGRGCSASELKSYETILKRSKPRILTRFLMHSPEALRSLGDKGLSVSKL